MKNLYWVALLLLLATPCSGQKKHLRLTLKTGNVYKLNLGTFATTTVSLGKKKEETFYIEQLELSFLIKGLKRGVYDMEVRYDKLVFGIISPTGGFAGNSDNPPHEKNPVSSILAEVKGKPFQVKMEQTGEIIDVRNLDEIWKNAWSNFQNAATAKNPLRGMIEKSGSAESFTNSVGSAFAPFPKHRVSPGDTWTKKMPVNAITPYDLDMTYELQNIGATTTTIHSYSDLDINDKETKLLTLGQPLKMKLSGTLDVEFKIENATGWPTDSKVNRKLSGYILVDKGLIPLTIETIQSINAPPQTEKK